MLNALLFDLDGTLADTDPIHFQTWREMLLGYELEIDAAFYRSRFSGRLNLDIVQDLLPQLSLQEGKDLSDRKEAAFRDRAAGMLAPLAGLLDLLTWADQQQLKQAIVTNAPVKNAKFLLQVLGFEHRFANVVLGDNLERGKPDPMPYQVALQQLNVEPEAAVAFEDSPSGIRSAVAAGILTVGMATTHDPEELQALGATLVVADFRDERLQGLLETLLQKSTPVPAHLG